MKKYPRVTEILEATRNEKSQKKLIKWQKTLETKLGIEQAKVERQKILDNGTALHLSIEKFLKDEYNPEPHQSLIHIKTLLILIKQKSDNLIIEKRLYSDKHQFTGKPDLICNYENQTTIFDWRSSGQIKKNNGLKKNLFNAVPTRSPTRKTTTKK